MQGRIRVTCAEDSRADLDPASVRTDGSQQREWRGELAGGPAIATGPSTESIFSVRAILRMPSWFAIVDVARWWKAFTIRRIPLEPSPRFRYILAVHTTCQGCPENAGFTDVFAALRRGAENPSLSATRSKISGKPGNIGLIGKPGERLCSTLVEHPAYTTLASRQPDESLQIFLASNP